MKRGILPAAYAGLTGLAGALARAGLGLRRLAGGRGKGVDLAQRLVLDRPREAVAPGMIWLHGASVGEIRSLAPLIPAILRRRPDARFLVTASTATGRQTARESLGEPPRLAPWDAPGPLSRFLERYRPCLHVVVETEIWPLRWARLDRRGVPLALVSARLSPEKWPRYRRWRGLYAPALASVNLLSPASAEDRRRFVELGADPSRLGPEGHLKWDAAPPAPAPGQAEELRRELGLAAEADWIVLGSVHPGEAPAILAALGGRLIEGGDLGVLVAPRHPRRFDEIFEELRAGARTPHRSSAGPAPEGARLILVDRLGLLPRLYPLARAAFLGGTLVEIGGHSPLEAAAAGCPLAAGPHCFQQVPLVEPLESVGALKRAASAGEVAEALARWIDEPAAREAAGRAAASEVERRRGLAGRLADAIVELLS